MRGHQTADGRPVAEHDVDDARRQPGLDQELRLAQRIVLDAVHPDGPEAGLRPTRAIEVNAQIDRPQPNLFLPVDEAGRTVAVEDPEVGDYAGRFERAFYNMLETFPAFAALVLMVEATESWTSLTAMGAQLYFWGRVFYVPAYVTGIPLVRTLIWAVATIGMCLIAWALVGVATGAATGASA